MNPILIFCPTRDRPESLKRTLKGINSHCTKNISWPCAIVIIDDSISKKNRQLNKCIVNKYSKNSTFYFGLQEEKLLIKQLDGRFGVSKEILNCYLRPLGSKNWDLGAIRNYALLLTNIIGMANATVVMIDDDVELIPQTAQNKNELLVDMIKIIKRNNLAFVGGNLIGDQDTSTLEKVCLQWNKFTKKVYFKLSKRQIPISGGLIIFSSYWASRIPFPRLYNEDWIWLQSCSIFGGQIIKSKIQARHFNMASINPNKETLYRELIGEIFFDGWNWAYRNFKTRQYCYRILRTNKYWLGVLAGHRRAINRLRVNFLKSKNEFPKYHLMPSEFTSNKLIFDQVCSMVKGVKAENMVDLTNEYIDSLMNWQRISLIIKKIARRIKPIF